MRLLILAFLAYLLYRVLKHFFGGPKVRRPEPDGGAIDEMVQDPWCKTYIPLREAEKRVIRGQTYFFCSKACADKFEENKEA